MDRTQNSELYGDNCRNQAISLIENCGRTSIADTRGCIFYPLYFHPLDSFEAVIAALEALRHPKPEFFRRSD